MTKTNNKDQGAKQTDSNTPADTSVGAVACVSQDSKMLTIEEHRKNLNIDAPVFAAVMQFKGWALEKTVSKAAFEEAVKSFLNSPVGGE